MAETKTGDRIIQVILLILIAAGIGVIGFLKNPEPAGTGAPGPGGQGGQRPQSAQTAPSGGEGQRSRPDPAGGNAIAVEAVPVQRTDVFRYIRVNGDVTVDNSVDIFSDTGGELVSANISLGDRVSKNEILFMVDPSLPGQNYSLSTVRSTISGTVINLPYKVGSKVTTGNAVATIGDLNDLMILTYIPERFVATLTEGLTADVSFDAFPGEVFKARITEINPVMDTTTRTLSVKLELLNRDERIRPGMFASMRLITEESRNTLSVPSQAVLSYYGDSVVYRINDKNQAERIRITTGLTSDEQVEILEGLEEGDRVITQGQSNLTTGTAVRAVDGNIKE
ncbi:MAG: efflux RND transporter periplasmic adaptor subunit [Spirochaetales bacterium]|nr:efflux RND transporter periplasmic adaptor subunit [Spirochaetales bacterium]